MLEDVMKVSKGDASSVFFADLSFPNLSEGKPFDGVASGVFTDMMGRKVELKAEDFPEYVENTLNLIEASRTESGELVGLPIDASNHDKGDAAGWIVGVELSGSIIRFVPKWTEKGLEYLRKGIRRMFSPTISLSNHTVLGGTLTNWPATRDSRGKVLLRPIELSQGLHAISEVSSTPENLILSSWREKFPDCELQSILEDHVIANSEGKLYHVDFSEASGKYLFSESPDWVEVELTAKLPPVETPDPLEGETSMTELSQEQLTELAGKVAALLPKPDPVKGDPLAGILELDGLSEDAKKQRKVELQGQLAALRKQAELEYREELVRLSFENSMTDLSQKLTQGMDGAPRALRVSAEELRAHLLKLPTDEAKFWGDLMIKTVKDGFVEFESVGSDGQPKGTHPLPEEIVEKLTSKEMVLADLSNPILALGDLAQYDLSAWK